MDRFLQEPLRLGRANQGAIATHLEFLVHIERSSGLYWLMGPSDVKQQPRSVDDSFTDFVTESGPRIQHALMAALGPELGQDAASEALAYGWQHWERVRSMENPAGYLYTVGRSRGRRLRVRPVFPPAPPSADGAPWIEPGLPAAVAGLSERQRVATLLVHGGGWTYAEVAELMNLDRGTVKKHADRGLAKLRSAMEVNLDA